MTGILWYKRDLRVTDHAAASAAAAAGPVVCLYIVEPGYWALPDTSARQWAFIRECLESLRAELEVPLLVRVGEATEVLEAVRQEISATHLFSHEETGNLWTFERDKAVARWARQAGVEWTELPQSGVVRRLKGRDGWAARRERYVRNPTILRPRLQGPFLNPGAIPTAQQLGLIDDPCPGRQRGGREAALTTLGGFLTKRGQTYRKAMSSPVDGEWACSRLSPYLALGVLTGREAAQAASGRKAEIPAGARDGWKGSLNSFTSRLAWRDHFMQKLEDEPRIETTCLHSAYEGLRSGSDPERLAAWAEGRTGLPFTDACMRYLRHTGWLNFRMRSMLMAVASYHLWLNWRDTGMILARLFTDYEPGIHWSQTQMQSGTTGMNTVRIYNPVKQGKDQDPTGVFTRRWVPELADVPDEFLQEPWKMGGVAGYPDPIVDVADAARAAREKVFAVRRGDAFRSEAQAIVTKHASRKKDRGFRRDPVPKKDPKTRAPDAQLKFDL
ncbi:FAD-binding domain-containing protein [Shimia ponticola]|uniref:FAD-binding domain-containing protein n=1 Tax=Shimia ponticola TaxID=2582893 RepID=UPI0011BE13F5|nr:FAD-binding domain-containing protein [Shimia ponticola]